MNDHRTTPLVTFSTHRLWKGLWTALGLTGDNASKAVGTVWGIQRNPAAIPSTSTATTATDTATVDANSGAELQICSLSPASTDPIATTFLYLTKEPTTHQAGLGRTHQQASCGGSRPTRGMRYPRARRLETSSCAERAFLRWGGSFQ